MSLETRIRCEGLRKSFGGVSALADVTLEFPPSGIVAIIGPNGAGKTTLLNILTGFALPDAGRVFLGSQDLSGLPPWRIARLGIVRTFQEVRIVKRMSVLDNILLGCTWPTGESVLSALARLRLKEAETTNLATALELLRFVGLDEAANDGAGALSYGEQKLLSLACCLATGARFLLLDEPVAGAAPQVIERIKAYLQKLKIQDRAVVVFVEHDLAVVRDVADHVIVMDEGRIVAQGDPGDVLSRPQVIETFVG